MKDKVDDFESKLTELGQVDTAAILGRLETVERGGEEYLRSAREQELKVGELSRRVDEVAAAAAAAPGHSLLFTRLARRLAKRGVAHDWMALRNN